MVYSVQCSLSHQLGPNDQSRLGYGYGYMSRYGYGYLWAVGYGIQLRVGVWWWVHLWVHLQVQVRVWLSTWMWVWGGVGVWRMGSGVGVGEWVLVWATVPLHGFHSF